MLAILQSILLGTAGLSLAAVFSALLSYRRHSVAQDDLAKITRLIVIATALHLVHFSEETFTGFHAEFPTLLGLAPWPISFFVSFNLLCVFTWILCIPIIRSHKLAIAAIWFLAIASAVNFVAHPLLSFFVGGYFPGLWSSPFVGVAGLILIRALSLATKDKKGH